MIPASYKLPLRATPSFFDDSIRLRTESCFLFVKQNTLGHVRAVIIVPKKKIPLATSRNALKRSLLPLLISTLQTKSLDIVIRINHASLPTTAKKTINEISTALYSAHLAV